MVSQRIQLIGWVIFIFYYFSAKYFVGGFTGFSVAYLFSVVALVALTAILPFYGVKWWLNRVKGPLKLVSALVLPTAIAILGLSLYFVIFIAPNYPNIKLEGILYRAIEPGVVITALLLVPIIGEKLAKREGAQDT